jgi:hypothetical protein
MFITPALFHKSPATNPAEEVGKLPILITPLCFILNASTKAFCAVPVVPAGAVWK